MNASLRQLQAFVALCQLSSFTRAAEKLYITQAGLSSMIKDLEGQLHCRLFVRTTRVVTPTPAGELLLPVALRAVRDLEQVSIEIGALGQVAQKVVRVAVTPLVAANFAPRVVRRFVTKHPEARIELVDVSRELIPPLVLSGEVDAGFGVFFNKAAGIRRVAIFPTPLVAVFPENSKLGQRGHSVCWRDLWEFPVVALPSDNAIQKLADKHLGQSIDSGNRIVLNNLETVISYVTEGFGNAVVPRFAMLACKQTRLRWAPLQDPTVPLDFYSITRAGSPVGDLAGRFIGEFAAAFTCVTERGRADDVRQL